MGRALTQHVAHGVAAGHAAQAQQREHDVALVLTDPAQGRGRLLGCGQRMRAARQVDKAVAQQLHDASRQRVDLGAGGKLFVQSADGRPGRRQRREHAIRAKLPVRRSRLAFLQRGEHTALRQRLKAGMRRGNTAKVEPSACVCGRDSPAFRLHAQGSGQHALMRRIGRQAAQRIMMLLNRRGEIKP